MQLENLTVEDLDGWHDDGWCNRLLRGRVRATAAATTFYADIWIKAETGNDRVTAASLSVETSTPEIVDMAREVTTRIQVAYNIEPDNDLAFRVYCENLLSQTGGDARELSFVLIGLGVK
ncbi:MAG: hypothetical protein RJA87_691 [Pseudomonadota bacterium]|jgi:hypothetical protein